MPPKRKQTQKIINKNTKRPSAISANIANSADLHAELRNLLSGEQFSQSGYVYVAVDPAIYNNSVNGSGSGSSQDPLGSQSFVIFQDEQVFANRDSEAEELKPEHSSGAQQLAAESGSDGSDGAHHSELQPVQVHPNDAEEVVAGINVKESEELQQIDRQCPVTLEVTPPDLENEEIRKLRKNISNQVQPDLNSELRESDEAHQLGQPVQVYSNGSPEVEMNPNPIDLTSPRQTSAVEIVAGLKAKGWEEPHPIEHQCPIDPPPDSECKSYNGDVTKKNAEIRKLRKKISDQEHQIVILKDNVLFLARENQELKDKQHIPSIGFTAEENINISLTEIAAIDSASHSDSIFVANLAIHFYGTDRLRNMSATGQPTPRFKNLLKDDGTLLYPAREQIEPKIFKFIFEKLTERVAQRLGPSKVKEVAYYANEHIVRKHIAQKISNLNKAAARHE